MSATRLLILGVLLIKQPIHGYDVRRELESWSADKWANIAYGSIYSALNKMAEEGLVEVVSTNHKDSKPARTEYTITESGRQEFERLLREYWWNWKPTIDPFQVALTFMNRLSRDELLGALRYRADLLRVALKGFEYMAPGKVSHPDSPRHIAENIHLTAAHIETELRWIEQAIEKVERGELP